MKKLFATLLASSLLLTSLAGCGFTGGNNGGTAAPGTSTAPGTAVKDTLTVYDSNEIRTLVQWAASDTQSFTILNNVFEGLYRLDANHEPPACSG